MTSLASLDVTNNKLTEVPPALQDLGHLGNETMNINNMSVLISITENFVTEVLYLRNNRLTKIPVLTHCLNLKELHLGSNKISGIQHGIPCSTEMRLSCYLIHCMQG